MNTVEQINYMIDKRLDSYRTIFRYAWAKEVSERVDGTPIDPLVFALCASWRAAANTHTLPWLMIQSVQGFWNGYAKPRGFTPRYVSLLADQVPKRMKSKMTVTAKQDLARVLKEIADQLNEAWNNDPDPEITPDNLWKEFCNPDLFEFPVAVFGSQQLTFSAIFFAYENFVTDLVNLANEGKTDYKPPKSWAPLVAKAKELLDPIDSAVVAKCLEDKFVTITRLARNCLAHRGGKESPELKATGHGLTVVNGVVNIMAPDNDNQMELLCERVSLMVEAALKIPKLGLPPGS